MPDKSHVGRRYEAPGQVIEPERSRQFAAAIGGANGAAFAAGLAPTYAAVYALAPTFAQLFTDAEVGVNLAGLIHGEQAFEWPTPAHEGDVVDASAEIVGVEEKRGMTFLTLQVEARRPADDQVVCRGRSMMIIRGAQP